jgi:hypothetical protein
MIRLSDSELDAVLAATGILNSIFGFPPATGIGGYFDDNGLINGFLDVTAISSAFTPAPIAGAGLPRLILTSALAFSAGGDGGSCALLLSCAPIV